MRYLPTGQQWLRYKGSTFCENLIQSLTFLLLLKNVIAKLWLFDRLREVKQHNVADQSHSMVDNDEVAESLRAALDVERSSAQQLTETLQQEREHIDHLTAELSRLNEQLTADRSLTAQLSGDQESAVVSLVIGVFSIGFF